MRVNRNLENFYVNYLRIGEFAKLVGCSVVSLRYYEEIGALLPAYVDPNTGYRYYTAQQTYQARLVRICIDVGISPKGLKSYFEEADVLEMYNLFDEFTVAVDARLREAQEKKELIGEMEIEYRRQLAVEPLKPRWIYARPALHIQMATSVPSSEPIDYRTYLQTMNELQTAVHELGLTPYAQQGAKRTEGDTWVAYLAIAEERGLAKLAREHERISFTPTRSEPYLTKSIHGASIEKCFENAYAEVPIDDIDTITDMWAFTMVTGIAAIEITYTDKNWPTDSSKIMNMVS